MNFIKGQATLTLAALADDDIHAIYMSSQDEIVLDAQKLGQVVNEKIESARGVNIYLGSFEEVWIAKFTSLVSHEIIHRVLTSLQGRETSRMFDRLYFFAFMQKLPESSIFMTLWSDALETNPIGDTWFG
jgi:hypothetical protein